jgi:hypothetical protein
MEGEGRCCFIKVAFMVIKEKRKFIECHLFGYGSEEGKNYEINKNRTV